MQFIWQNNNMMKMIIYGDNVYVSVWTILAVVFPVHSEECSVLLVSGVGGRTENRGILPF